MNSRERVVVEQCWGCNRLRLPKRVGVRVGIAPCSVLRGDWSMREYLCSIECPGVRTMLKGAAS